MLFRTSWGMTVVVKSINISKLFLLQKGTESSKISIIWIGTNARIIIRDWLRFYLLCNAGVGRTQMRRFLMIPFIVIVCVFMWMVRCEILLFVIKLFLSLRGISNCRVQTLKKNCFWYSRQWQSWETFQPTASDETKTKVFDFIKVLIEKKSHYSPKDSRQIYFPEELNIKELHTFYKDKHPENNVGYTTFRDIFKQQFYASLTSDETDTVDYADDPPIDEYEVPWQEKR